MNITDRGNKKWTSIMMPEHIKMLNQMWEEQEYKKKPILDEQQITENNLMLQDALENNLKISIKHFHNHDFEFTEGFIQEVDINKKIIVIENSEIKFENVINVKSI